MKKVYVISHNIFSPLGKTSAENFSAISRGLSAIKKHHDPEKSNTLFFASLFEKSVFLPESKFTKFEQLLINSVTAALSPTDIDVTNEDTALIISSTKGNISLLENHKVSPHLKEQIRLSVSAKKIAAHFGFISKPVIISHACISGLVALITAKRLLQAGRYKNILVAGADVVSKFILSGFQSFQAVSNEPCKPFDKNRKGINLGEAAATIILSVNPPESLAAIEFCGGAVSNDANHISGPSRTGEELFMAIGSAIKEAAIDKKEIGFISAHGTATVYNDDMESKAITLAGLQTVPLNSLKGYYGHTLGAAGLLETAVSLQSLMEGKIVPTKGFETPGTAMPVNVCSKPEEKKMNAFLKTGSGFGGCNAAVVFKKKKEDH